MVEQCPITMPTVESGIPLFRTALCAVDAESQSEGTDSAQVREDMRGDSGEDSGKMKKELIFENCRNVFYYSIVLFFNYVNHFQNILFLFNIMCPCKS